MFVYIICCPVLYYHCHRVNNQFAAKFNSIQFNSIQFFIIYVPSQQPQGQIIIIITTVIYDPQKSNPELMDVYLGPLDHGLNNYFFFEFASEIIMKLGITALNNLPSISTYY
jgi:menaquinone-dependent protoporphyrinogen IX oxidase